MVMYIGFILSIVFVISFVGFSSKPSPIYGGLVLVMSGGIGCGIVMSFGGSFLGLMVFLIYLGGMLVVFGYTTAMATEQYPEAWVSNATVLSAFILGVLMEVMLVLYMFKSGEVEVVFKFSGMGDWVVCDSGDFGIFSEEIVGVSALYSYGVWVIVITGWSLFVGVLVVLEITRGA
uniref:NADH-ubiquinone oxidoreductase chain 6 n=1 Tax=Rhinoceros sondaicus TaxID=102233 RepID=A0A343CED6_RHISO|nr:NADH dehydrogenase subunit 6 [Rhinoceros sondaicus]QIU82642.1 NADH dehydrogenase subunit 6 [Rhinoceros sondaicus]QIU82695.1 NADH dehydrogenase subunit 6 [Rhinoceros sondaicus]QIU82722.1 NADH dehydrogenase subunit 6 [Rhinoceros sondaicus]